MPRVCNPCLFIGLIAMTPVIASAHHSFAMFDQTKDMTLMGTIKELQWVNPHSWLQVLVKDDSGKEIEWSIEMGGPASLYREGWRQSAIKAGDKVQVTIHPLRDGRAGGSLVSTTFADGTLINERGGAPPPAPTSESKEPGQ